MKTSLLLLILFYTSAYSQVRPNANPGASNSVNNRPQHDPPEVINSYTEVLLFDVCTNAVTILNDSSFKIGDTVLLIQMKGAVIDTSNTAAFGTVFDYRNAGNYEFNYISQKAGNVLTFKNRLTKTYDIPGGVVQLVRVPYLKNAAFVGGLTCMRWNGSKGGVLAVIGRNGLTSYENIDVTGMGFRGGEGYSASLTSPNCYLLPACFRIGSASGSCKINRIIGEKRFVDQEQDGI